MQVAPLTRNNGLHAYQKSSTPFSAIILEFGSVKDYNQILRVVSLRVVRGVESDMLISNTRCGIIQNLGMGAQSLSKNESFK